MSCCLMSAEIGRNCLCLLESKSSCIKTPGMPSVTVLWVYYYIGFVKASTYYLTASSNVRGGASWMKITKLITLNVFIR